MRTTAQLREAWAPACGRTETIDLVPGIRIAVNPAATEALRALGRVLQAHRYQVRREDTGSYNCRQITGGTGHSLHAHGIAVDLNWNSNPYRADNRLVTDMPAAMVDDIKRIRTRGGHRVFRWGGDYVSVKDAMHYEIVASPAELAGGIDWSTVRQGALDEGAPASWPVIQPGERGTAVAILQERLVRVGLMTTAEVATGPGLYGPRTQGAVREYQRSRGLTPDGIVGLQTWTALLTDQPAIAPGEPSPVKGQHRAPVPEMAEVIPEPRPLPTTPPHLQIQPITRPQPQHLEAAALDLGIAPSVLRLGVPAVERVVRGMIAAAAAESPRAAALAELLEALGGFRSNN